ncbi:MAG TPA: DUF58 domain-containing protein [Cerasibacillus sp.]|uniref:DUF58 domain-containing protein n=1 Tax=Cerasibacillus sp. TaxID=2498711 RepID=UPI002F405213
MKSWRFLGPFFVLTILIVLFSFAMFQGGFISWFLFFSFLPLVIYQMGLLFYPFRQLDVTRTLSHSIGYAGQSITVDITIKRKIPFPLFYCIVEEVLPDSLQRVDTGFDKYVHIDDPDIYEVKRQTKQLLFPFFRRKIKASYTISQLPRGEHQLTQIRIRTGDIFGFIKKEHHFPANDTLLVFPNKRRIRFTNTLYSLEQGQAIVQSNDFRQTNVVVGVREYLPGDKFSWIDWKQSAKKQDIMTKEFEQEKSMEAFFILDASSSSQWIAFEGLIEVMYGMMDMIHKTSDSKVGLLSIGKETSYFPFHFDVGSREKVMKHLAMIKPDHKDTFTEQLQRQTTALPTQSLVFVFSCSVDIRFIESMKKLYMKHKKRLHVILLLSKQQSFELQDAIDMLTGHQIRLTVLTETQLVKEPLEVRV